VFAVFPFININSPSAELVNGQIKARFEKDTQTLGEEFIGQLGWVELFRGYDVFYSGNLMTLLCYDVGAFTDVPHWSYYPYTFNLETGELLSSEQLLEAAGLTVEELHELTEAKIRAIVQNNAESYKWYDDPEEMIEADIETSIARYYGAGETYFSHEGGVEQELTYYRPMGFFVVDGVLYVYMYIENPAHWGWYPKIFPVNNDELYAPVTIEKHSYM
jgi:hypothetical protein